MIAKTSLLEVGAGGGLRSALLGATLYAACLMKLDCHAARIPTYDRSFAAEAGVAAGREAELLKRNEESKSNRCPQGQWTGGKNIGPAAGDILG